MYSDNHILPFHRCVNYLSFLLHNGNIDNYEYKAEKIIFLQLGKLDARKIEYLVVDLQYLFI